MRLKVAATFDGRTALADGTSQWITGAEHAATATAGARAPAPSYRRRHRPADNPRLTAREVATPRQPLRVIVDSRLETPASARILEGGTC